MRTNQNKGKTSFWWHFGAWRVSRCAPSQKNFWYQFSIATTYVLLKKHKFCAILNFDAHFLNKSALVVTAAKIEQFWPKVRFVQYSGMAFKSFSQALSFDIYFHIWYDFDREDIRSKLTTNAVIFNTLGKNSHTLCKCGQIADN